MDALRVAFGGEASEGTSENAAETNAALDALAKRLEEVISATGLGESWCTNKCTLEGLLSFHWGDGIQFDEGHDCD